MGTRLLKPKFMILLGTGGLSRIAASSTGLRFRSRCIAPSRFGLVLPYGLSGPLVRDIPKRTRVDAAQIGTEA